MRWIVFILAFANIGYFGWSVYQQSHSGYQVVSEPARSLAKTGRRLVLVSESNRSANLAKQTTAENKVVAAEPSSVNEVNP